MKSVKKYQEGGRSSVTQYFRPLKQEEMTGIREGLQEYMKRKKKEKMLKEKKEAVGNIEEKIDPRGPSRISTEQPKLKVNERQQKGRTRHKLLLDEIRRSAGFGRSSKVDLTRKNTTGPRA